MRFNTAALQLPSGGRGWLTAPRPIGQWPGVALVLHFPMASGQIQVRHVLREVPVE
jgi:hypothetical protein